MTTRNYLAFAAIAILCTGCGLLSPAQQQTAIDTINEMLRQGTINENQHGVLMDGVLQQGWSGFLEQLTGYALAAVAAYTGVQIRRGPPTRLENIAKKLATVAEPATPAS
jgi:hypothetical protein